MMIRSLYDWTLRMAQSKYAESVLFLVAFVESSFLPIPPDVLLIVMVLADRTKWFRYFLICTVASTMGGLLGYLIGFHVWQAVGPWFFAHVFSEEIFEKVQNLYSTHDFWVVFVAAFTPIPYKVFTITAGVMKIDMIRFLIASFVGRGARFLLVSGLLYFFGPSVRDFIEKRFGWFTIVFTIILIGGFVSIKFLAH